MGFASSTCFGKEILKDSNIGIPVVYASKTPIVYSQYCGMGLQFHDWISGNQTMS